MNTNIHYVCFKNIMMIDIDFKDSPITESEIVLKIKIKQIKLNTRI